jgi:hypothetical protein
MRITSIFRSIALGIALASAAIAPVACSGETGGVATDPAKAEVDKLVADFSAAWSAQDYDKMLALSLPEPLLDEIMRQFGVDASENRDKVAGEIKALMEQALSQAKVIKAEMDAKASKIEATSTGRKYAVVPAVIELSVGDVRAKSTGSYLAFEEAGRWYLIDPSSDETIATIKKVFPDLADVKLTPSKMEIVTP